MFLGYCLIPINNTWTPPVRLETAEAAFMYCTLHYKWTDEIRITDEDDFVVLHMEHRTLKIPMPDGSIREHPLP
jgi:hypothetical protein